VEEPAEKQCVMVIMGLHSVMLPLPKDTRSLDELSRSWVGDHDITQRIQAVRSCAFS